MGTNFNGMNGTIVRKVEDLPVGRVPGEPYGYVSDLLVTIDVRVERLERRETYETTTHERVTGPLDFALTTSVWQPSRRDIVAGGATAAPLDEAIAHGRLDFGLDEAAVRGLALDHECWHLNGMSAACAHQEVVWEDSDYGRRPSLTLTQPCPVTGYRYGSAWLVRVLPEGFLAELDGLLSGAHDQSGIYRLPGTETDR